jgi:haloalkane dehalogenase
MPPERVDMFKWLRTPEGEREALDKNIFVESMLFDKGIIRELSELEKEVYRYSTNRPGGTKLPGVMMPNDIPFDGDPADTHKLVKFYADWLAETDMPKLFIKTDEGHGLAGAARDYARTFKNQTEVTVHGRHYMQEDVPDAVGAAVAEFVKNLRR